MPEQSYGNKKISCLAELYLERISVWSTLIYNLFFNKNPGAITAFCYGNDNPWKLQHTKYSYDLQCQNLSILNNNSLVIGDGLLAIITFD